MAHRIPKSAEDTGKAEWPPEWMTTYSDMATLLMTFFIILSCMLALNIDITWVSGQKMISLVPEEIQDTTDIELSREEKDLLKKIRELKQQQMMELAKINEMQRMAKEVQQYIIDANLSSFVRVEVSKWKLKIVPVAPFLFRPGSAALKAEGKTFLTALSKFFLYSPTAQVRITGHTDDVPIKTPRFPSNWELSCARATVVMRYLTDECGLDPQTLSAVGYGPYQPVMSNATPEGRAKNRRVEIEIIQRPGLPVQLPESGETGVIDAEGSAKAKNSEI
ncbi:MAG: flagellar motor protein MotB [PVC group bacterium]